MACVAYYPVFMRWEPNLMRVVALERERSASYEQSR